MCLSVQFSCSVVSKTLWPHRLQHARPPCPSPTPEACLNSCPSSWWCHPTTSSSVVPFSSCLLSFPALGSFPVSQFFTSGGQSIGASPSASVLPMSIQGWFPLQNWLVWFPCSPRDSQESWVFNITVQKPQFFSSQLSLWSSSHIHNMTIGKTIALIRWTFIVKVMSLLFNTLSRFVIAFLPRSKVF